jgi:hypothetical protein
MKNNFVTLLGILIISTLLSPAVTFAKMAQRQHYQYESSKIIASLKSAPTSDTKALELMKLAVLSKEIFQIETIYSYTQNQTELTTQDFLSQIKINVSKDVNWNQKLTEKALKNLEMEEVFLRNVLGNGSLSWAWVLNKFGKKEEARKVITKLFEDQFKKVMSRKEVTFFNGQDPLSEIESSFRILESIGGKSTDIQEKLQNAKKHISTLPQSHIMT